jgi:sialate O-acetylesterase
MLPLLLSVVHIAAGLTPPPAPCPPACDYDQQHKCCGVYTSSASGGSCSCPSSVLFSTGIDNDMVLQRAPAKAAVYGSVLEVGATVEVTVEGGSSGAYTVQADTIPVGNNNAVAPGGVTYAASWKALLKPAPAGGSLTITAKCTAGCGTGATRSSRDVASIERVTHGDVYFCSGQSNMALPLVHTFSAKALQAEMLAGKYDKLRFFQFGGMKAPSVGHQPTPTYTQHSGAMTYSPAGSAVSHSWFNATFVAAVPPTGDKHDLGPLMGMSATCVEFGRSLLDQLGPSAPPIGLVSSAVGGTTIESWSPNATTMQCQNTTVDAPTAGKPDGSLFNGMACPFVNMTISGFVWYQGENNMHGDPGSSLHGGGGYGCMVSTSNWTSYS